MTFIDTNYFLRFLLDDNHEQHLKAKKLILDASNGKKQLFTSIIVIFEIYWVLSSYYGKDKSAIAKVLRRLLDMEFIDLEERDDLVIAVKLYSKGIFCLEDCYNLTLARHLKAKSFATFDQKLLKAFEK